MSNSVNPVSGPAGQQQIEARAPLIERLTRLKSYLLADPGNESLRSDIFDTALMAGDLDTAEQQIADANGRQLDPSKWRFREASLRMAQRRFDEARQLLLETEMAVGAHPVISLNLAQIEFLQQRYQQSCELLRPWMEMNANVKANLKTNTSAGATPIAIDPAMEVLWLRSLHRTGMLEQAWKWSLEQRATGSLSERAAGIASLIAVDADHLPDALVLSELALTKEPQQMEALVARASVALAQRDVERARTLLASALACNPSDGRAWSASGFAEMLGMNLEQAQQHFTEAVRFMPGHIGTWQGMAWVCLLRKDLAGARRAFESAYALDHNFAESHGGMAVVLAMQGERMAAADHIERAMRLDKSNLSARYAQAILSGEAADLQAIERLAHRLLGQRPAPLGGMMGDWLEKKPG